jgi:hypothetical protein
LTKIAGVDFWLLSASGEEPLKDGDIGKLSNNLQKTVTRADGSTVHHLIPEAIEDIIMVCHYSAKSG